MMEIYDAADPIFPPRTRYLRAIDLQITLRAEPTCYAESSHKYEPTVVAKCGLGYHMPPTKCSLNSPNPLRIS